MCGIVCMALAACSLNSATFPIVLFVSIAKEQFCVLAELSFSSYFACRSLPWSGPSWPLQGGAHLPSQGAALGLEGQGASLDSVLPLKPNTWLLS